MIRFKIRTATTLAIVLAAVCGLNFTAHAADPNKLESIEVQTLSGQQVQLKLHLSGPPAEPLPFTIDKPARMPTHPPHPPPPPAEPMPFTIDKPARIAFDLPDTTLALTSRRVDVHSGGVDSVVAAEANGRTRLVVNGDSLLPYTTKVDGNTIIVTLGSPPGAALAKLGEPARAGAGQPAAAAARSIRTIDFRRGSDG